VWGAPPTVEDELDDEKLEPAVHLNKSFANFVVVDNIPVATPEKFEKLKGVISKIFTSLAGPFNQLNIPLDDQKTTKGYAFIEFQTPEGAQTAVEKINGYRLDKAHVFKVTSWDDFQKYLATPDTYVAPEIPNYEPRENLRSWLLDDRAIDQYVVRYGDITEVLWNELKPAFGEPNQDTVVKRDNWTESYVAWSPHGSYLATFHTEGVALWGGPEFSKLARFRHPGVKLIDFSPCEKYLVTASPQFQENDDPKDPQCIIVWDIRNGTKLRGFLGQVPGQTATWPFFKWSGDDKYVARLSEDTISIYETPSMDLLEKKSIKIPGVKDFAWSPTDNIISYFVPEANNKPASVVLLEIPSRTPRSQKNLFNVHDCKMYWHPNGDFLSVKVDRTTKTKKTTMTDFAIFRMRERGIPIEVIETKEAISLFAWEPKGNKFAVVNSETPRVDVSFYAVEHKVKLLKTLEKKPVSHLYWSPQGGFIVLAGLGNLNGTFEFFNANELETMGTEEHFNASVVEWDPTGRYIATVVSYWRHQVENGYNIYSFNGKLLKHVLKEKFYHLVWRPRPPSLLSKERIEYVKKNIKEYAKQLKAEDKKKLEIERAKKREKREAMRREFEAILSRKEKEYQSHSDDRKELRLGEESDDEEDYETREQWVEEIEEIKEIIINED